MIFFKKQVYLLEYIQMKTKYKNIIVAIKIIYGRT